MATRKMIAFSPFTRVEGDLRLGVEIENGQVVSARASGTLFRNFENLMRGRDPRDAIVILCRICGQCGAAHSRAAARALANAYGVTAPPNGEICASIVNATEVVLSHLSHFYLSFAPDLCRLPGWEGLSERFTPIRGTSFRRALRVRRVLLGVMGLFAGKWPNTLAIQPGGVTKPLSRGELVRVKGILSEFARALGTELLRCSVEQWLENRSMADVEEWLGEAEHADGDLGVFISASLACGLEQIGSGPRRFISSGGFPLPDGEQWLPGGFYDGEVKPLDQHLIAEDAAFSWFDSSGGPAHPSVGTTEPDPAREEAYTWAKAPRYGGVSAEVGPMARMLIGGDPLAADLMARWGPSVFTRQLLRLHELVRLVEALTVWVAQIDPDEPFCVPCEMHGSGEGFALAEAPRGLLGHWVRTEDGRVRSYQVVTPTSWNLSPRDAGGAPGPLEEALEGTPVRDPQRATNVALVVRSYDPCLYCSVH